jgi:hypothetical protein
LPAGAATVKAARAARRRRHERFAPQPGGPTERLPLRHLVPKAAALDVERHPLPNLRDPARR